jgi:protein-tyrosine-phosphatase
MAAAFFNEFADRSKAEAVSVGTEPGDVFIPRSSLSCRKLGIDLSKVKPQKLTQDLANSAQLLITMGCGDRCPYVPGLRRDDWPLRNPKGLPEEDVSAISDKVKARVLNLIDADVRENCESRFKPSAIRLQL